MYGALDDLGQVGLELQDRQLVAIAGRTIVPREWVWQAAKPLTATYGENASTCSALKRSQTSCNAVASSQDKNPLSSSS